MPVKALDHVNLRTARLEEMRRFYTEVLGMESEPWPPFPFGDRQLHISDPDGNHIPVDFAASEAGTVDDCRP